MTLAPPSPTEAHSARSSAAVLTRRDVAFGLVLASTSGAAVLVHAFGALPMVFTVPFVVMPTSILLSGAILLRRRLHARFRYFAETLARGASAGLLATLAYDAVRPVLRQLFGFDFNPYRAMTVFGELMTGLPGAHAAAQLAGWSYHFWNGISFGMMYALMRPRGGMVTGFVWAMILQGAMMAAYPAFLQARLNDPGFLTMGIVGHGLWGIVLGHLISRTAHA